MKVYILVAGMGDKPNGGTRIIYEHANRLAERGHTVCLIHIGNFPSENIRGVPRRIFHFLMRKFRGQDSPNWFRFNSQVERRYYFFPRIPTLSAEDILVATYFRTHEIIPRETLETANCLYLVQGVETAYVKEAKLVEQWCSPSKNLVVSRWLQRKLSEVTETPTLIPNAIDRSFFSPSNARTEAECTSILFFSMKDPNKGSRETISALNAIRNSHSTFRVTSFGDLDPRDAGLRLPCEHHHMPPQTVLRDLYRKADIYISSSKQEGWGLTLAEATSCGAALAVSDATGHFEFARPDKSALFHERGRPDQLAHNLQRLIDDPEIRRSLVTQAQLDLEPYNWENATDQMEKALFGDTQSSSTA